eukprot:218168-Prymnesium_polylepis.1
MWPVCDCVCEWARVHLEETCPRQRANHRGRCSEADAGHCDPQCRAVAEAATPSHLCTETKIVCVARYTASICTAGARVSLGCVPCLPLTRRGLTARPGR